MNTISLILMNYFRVGTPHDCSHAKTFAEWGRTVPILNFKCQMKMRGLILSLSLAIFLLPAVSCSLFLTFSSGLFVKAALTQLSTFKSTYRYKLYIPLSLTFNQSIKTFVAFVIGTYNCRSYAYKKHFNLPNVLFLYFN